MSKHYATPTARTQFWNTMGEVEYIQDNRSALAQQAMNHGVPRREAFQQLTSEISFLLDRAAWEHSQF